jgi:hypothetical protein
MNKFQSFIELPIFNDEYVYGTNKSLPFIVINKEGDWREHLQIPEDQYRNGFESQSCITFSILDAGVEILQEAQYGILKQNYSERYISTLSGTTPSGNNPHRVAETIRRYGLVSEEVLPFDSTIDTWNEFFDVEKVEALKAEGKKWLREWDFKHEWIITKQTPQHAKRSIIERFLKVSPVGVTVCAWFDDGRGGYYRPEGLKDNHFAVIVGQDAEYFYIADTYPPYLKKVSKNYDFMYAKRFMLTKRERTFISFIMSSLWK